MAVGQAVGVDDLAALDVGQLGPRPTRRVRPGRRLAGALGQLGFELADRAGPVGVRVVPALEDLQEDPLGPAVERDVGGRHAPPVVVAQAQPPELAAHRGDVRLGRDPRVLAGLHRVLLGRQPEGVEAHRVEHVVAGHPLVAGEHVGTDVPERVADVETVAAGVGEHVQDVELGPSGHLLVALGQQPGRVRRGEGVLPEPALLPAQLDLRGAGRVVPELGLVGGGGGVRHPRSR